MPIKRNHNDNLVVEFGYGNVLNTIASRQETEWTNNALILKHSDYMYKIGSAVDFELDFEEDDLIILDFESIESLDVILEQLEKIRREMVNQNEYNSKS